MFSKEEFAESCARAIRGTDAEKAIWALVEEAVSDPAELLRRLPARESGGFSVLHHAPELTILDFTWPAWISLKPHNHCMWSVVGIFAGREDNIFWRRTPDSIEAAGARSLSTGNVSRLGVDIIHSVVNPTSKLTRAIHVYGGDFFEPPSPRSEWDPETLAERPWDLEDTRRLFLEATIRANAR